MNDMFSIFDFLIKRLDTFPLEMQLHITSVQKIDNRIVKHTRRFQKYYKKCLKTSTGKFFTKAEIASKMLGKLQKKREIHMNKILSILNDTFGNFEGLLPADLKDSLTLPYKQSSILKTYLKPEDIPKNVKQPKCCKCRGPAYGDMIRCDGNGCKILWFHFNCVHLTVTPKNNWYCSDCRNTIQ